MLVLSRQRDESIIIGDDIEITVHRKEVYDAIRRENREAAQVKPEDISALGKLPPKPPKGPDKKST